MQNESWIDKAIEKQNRDAKDVPRYMLDAYAGNNQSSTTKQEAKK